MIEPLEQRRLLFAGQFETTFGVGGETSLPGFDDTARVEQVVGTYTDADTGLENIVLRLNGDRFAVLDIGGRYVDSFSNDGILDVDFQFSSGIDVVDAVLDAANDRIIYISSEEVSSVDRFVLRIVDLDGTSGTFSSGNQTTLLLDAAFDDAQRITLRNDGSIAVAGFANVTGTSGFGTTSDGDLIVSVYRSDGVLTGGFGTRTFTDTEGIDITVLTSDSNGILYAGFIDETFNGFENGERAFVARLGFDGQFSSATDLSVYDDSFEFNGDAILDIAETPDGIRVLHGIDNFTDVVNDFESEFEFTGDALVLDVPFETTTPSVVLQDPTEFVDVTAAKFDASGRIVTVGLRDGEPVPFAAGRFASDGTYDLTYGSTGFTEFNGRPLLLDDARVLNTNSDPDDGDDPIVGLLQTGAGQTVGGNVDILREGSRATITGSAGNDSVRISFRQSDDRFVIRGNGVTTSIPRTAGLSINLGDGNDELIFAQNFLNISNPAAPTIGISAGAGDDTVRGSVGSDSVLGESGDDFLYGFGDGDYLFGGAGNDFIFGGDGEDYAEGGSGDDSLNGNAQGDRLLGNSGTDTVNGAGGNDFLFGGADADDIRGGGGTDRASNDVLDTYDSVEELLA